MSMDSWNWHRRLIHEIRAGALQKFLRLPRRQRQRYLQTATRLILVDLGLRIAPLPTLLRWLHRRAATRQAGSLLDDVEEVARLVELADRHGLLPPSCLRRSLVLAWFLSERGATPALRIGVARDDGQLLAHAWLEVPGMSRLSLFADPGYVALSQARLAEVLVPEDQEGRRLIFPSSATGQEKPLERGWRFPGTGSA